MFEPICSFERLLFLLLDSIAMISGDEFELLELNYIALETI